MFSRSLVNLRLVQQLTKINLQWKRESSFKKTKDFFTKLLNDSQLKTSDWSDFRKLSIFKSTWKLVFFWIGSFSFLIIVHYGTNYQEGFWHFEPDYEKYPRECQNGKSLGQISQTTKK